MSLPLQDQVAIITGGGGAIGRAIARQLADAGAKTILFDHVLAAAEQTAAEITAQGGEALPRAVDVTDYAAVSAAVDDTHSRFRRIDILVNCAGGSARDRMRVFHEQSIEVIHWMLHVNLFGALHCIRAASPRMVAAKRGRIINITSIVARGGMANNTEYGAAKGGIIAASKSLAIELGPHNITINCVSPGKVERSAVADEAAFARRYTVLNRICRQDDLARVVRFLALPESDLITGQDIAVDGGRSLGLRGDN